MRCLAVCAVAFACSASHPATDAGPDVDASADAAPDARPARPQLAAAGVQLLTAGADLGLQVTPADLATDADVLELHQEFYGIPWEAFAANTAPPPAWTAKMDAIASAARATGKPVFLSISMLNGARKTLAARTTMDGGRVTSQDNWATPCFDFATDPDGAKYKQAYLRYAAWMVDRFDPHWLNVAIEVNLMFEACPAAIGSVIDVANATYDAVKRTSPARLVFPSFQIDHLYGYATESCPSADQRAACFDRNYAQIVPMKRDRFAMSSYPIPLVTASPAALPGDWFTRGAARAGERALIAETGMISTPLVVKPRDAACVTLFTETATDATAYLTRVLDAARAGDLELVNWWSDRDLVVSELMTSCPCSFDTAWCTVLDIFRGPPTTTGPDTQLAGELGLKAFGTMGLRDYAGAPKPAYAVWAAFRAGS